MKIITLTTDYGLQDYHLAAYKGLIYNTNNTPIQIIDISHNTQPYDLQQGIYNLSNAWRSFPKKTIHQFRIGEELLRSNRFLICEKDEHYFILPDNGVITMLFPFDLPKRIIAVENTEAGKTNSTFLANIIAHLDDNSNLNDLGNETTIYKEKLLQQPVSSSNFIRGIIQYVDRYGNLITNITKELFEEQRKGREFNIYFRVVKFNEIHNNYKDVNYDKICFFNSAGFLQLSFFQGNASELFGLNIADSIQIDFANKA